MGRAGLVGLVVGWALPDQLTCQATEDTLVPPGAQHGTTPGRAIEKFWPETAEKPEDMSGDRL